MKLKNNNNKSKFFFRITITKKIFFLYILLSVLTVFFTSLFSFFIFLRSIDAKIKLIDMNKNLIKNRLESIFKLKERYQGSNKLELPDLQKLMTQDSTVDFTASPFKKILADYPNYSFKFENIEGVLEYKEDSKLIYDNFKGKYYIEVTRQINFEENLPFKNLKLSVKLSFYGMMLKSLFLASLITLFLLVPLIILFSRNITSPILKISQGARDIASGNLGVKVNVNLNDELGELARTFNYMSKELHKIKRIRDDLLAVISHELRSPLSRIKGYTELLSDLKLKKEERNYYLDSILSEIDFLNKMINEIIEISRLELNKEQMIKEVVDLNTIFNSLRKEFEIISKKNGIEFLFDTEENLLCFVDPGKIKRVFTNVVDNSIKANATKIYISAKKIDDKILIKVIDNGIGIPEEQLEIVFEKFYRVDQSRNRNTGGFGLGLAICKGIINEHKGNIFFVKRDNGAELHIELPFYKKN